MKLRKLNNWPWPLIYSMVAFLLVLSVYLIGVPAFITWRVKQETQFKNGTDTYKKLTNISVPLFFIARIFNVTNPDAIEKGEKFRVEEVGPYVYEETRVKNVVKIDEEGDTVTYFETKTFHFRRDLSNGSEMDLVNSVNFPYLSAATLAKRYVHVLGNVITWTLESLGESIIRRNLHVKELIFNGMDIDPIYNTLTELSPAGIPQQFVGPTFSYFNAVNASHNGEFKVMSGVKDFSKFGNVVSWRGEQELPFWTNKSLPADKQLCNKINGSDGSIVPPFLTKDRNIYIFYDLLCRSLRFTFRNESNFEGIPSWQFGLPTDIFDSYEKKPENECFCMDPGGGLANQCLDGMYRVFSCFSGSPLVFSKPHFLDADPRLINGVEGLNPSKEKHESTVEFEPISAMTLKASVKIQLVAELQPLEVIPTFDNVPHVFLPVMWIEQLAYLDEPNVNFIKFLLVIPLKIVKYTQWISFTLAGVMLILAIFRTARKNSHSNKERAIIELSVHSEFLPVSTS